MDKQRYDIMIGMQAGELAAGVKSAKKDLKDLRQAFKDTLDVLNTSPERFGQKITAELETARKKAAQLVAEVEKLQKTGKMNLADATPKQRSQLMAGVSQTQSAIRAAQPSVIQESQLKVQQRAMSELQNKSITLRYALYDVASAAQQASDTMLRYATASIGAAAAQERAFSQIEKTMVGVDPAQVEALRKELLALSTTIPVSFTELTKIGMLGSQLGIAAEDVASFTSVVAKFTAITGVTVEEAAMGFGKLQNLLGLNGDQFEALGSAIAKVGVESAATEQQIINTAGQFAAVAKAAGLSASEVIGLAASFASLKIAPEEARGVIVRTFNEINTAVSSFSQYSELGSERLKRFAEIAGVSSKEFAEGWGDKNGGASEIFEKFIKGLSTRNVSSELRQLGLDGIRTSKGLTALAGDFDAIFGPNGTIEIARQAGTEGTFLDISFSTVVEDLASKLDMLKNSFENLLASAAGDESFLNLIGGIVDGITRFNDILTRASQNSEVFRGFVQATIVIAALGAAFLGLLAIFALSGAGFAAMRTAFFSMQTLGISLGSALGFLRTQLATLTGTAAATTTGFVGMGAGAAGATVGVGALSTSLRVLKLAIASTGIGLIAIVIGEIAAAFIQAADASEDGVVGLDEVTGALEEQEKAAAAAKAELMAFIKQGLEPIADSVKAQDSLFNLGKALRANGEDWSEYSEGGRANITALQSTIESYVTAFGGDAQLLADNLLALRDYMIQMGLGGELAFQMLNDAIGETGIVAQKAVFNFASLDDGFNKISAGAGRAKTALELMTEAFEKAFKELDATVNIEDILDRFGESLTKNGYRIDTFSESGRANFGSLRDVIFGLKDTLAGNPQSLANSLASLREAMIRVGITSTVAFQSVDLAIKATGRTGRASAEIINALVGTISQAAQQAKKLTTITDYVSDLSSVLSDALNNRYARQDAKDSISSAWDAIAESAKGAKESIDEANRAINDMRSTRGVLEYQLRVAIRYGDTLRAEAIRARLSQVDSEIIAKREELAKVQEEANKTLVGNSKSAIENRAAIRDLVNGYNDYLSSLALTGMSNDQLKAEAKKLGDEFLEQGQSLGFAKEELLEYTGAFERDFTTVINNLPKEITLNIVTDPALQAVVDFVKDANAELAKLLSGTPSITQPAVSLPSLTVDTGAIIGDNRGGTRANPAYTTLAGQVNSLSASLTRYEREIKELTDKQTYLNTRVKTPTVRAELSTIASQLSGLRTARNWTGKGLQEARTKLAATPQNLAQGGMVRGPGSSTSDSINARLSNGEYVLRANAVKYYGTDFMNSLNQMQVQKGASSNQGSGVVYLSPEDRALLRSAIDRPISLYTENTKIASSANAGNVVLAQRGAR
jgi:TP901 family phage tail tape measure protein